MDTAKIHFHYLVPSFYFPARTQTKVLMLDLFKNEGFAVQSVNYIFCSDEYLLEINRAHLNHDTYTDIITFQYSEPSKAVLSDIYISVDRVRENSKNFKTPFSRELSRVILHGALHLCGYKDKTKPQIQKMRCKEEFYLDKLFHVK